LRGSEICFFTPKKEYKLRAFCNRVLARKYGTKTDNVIIILEKAA
jgi:hypothetical protein